MFKFFSRKETKSQPDRLRPYGWAGAVKQVHDDIGWYEQERARIDGRSFGHRQDAPERPRLTRKTPAERLNLIPRTENKLLARHPSSLFRR